MILILAQAAALFTAPVLAGIGAAAVSIPIIIHLMSRIRRKPEPWGAMRFLLEAYRKQKKKLQLEQWLLLATRCLLVLFAGLALAGPLLSGCSDAALAFGPRGRVVYLVIDDGLSTQTAAAGGETRFDGLKKQALEVVDQMEEGDRAVIVRMGRPAGLVTEEPSGDKNDLKQTIEAMEPGFARGELIDAMMLVQGSMSTTGVRVGDAVVVVLSDFPRSANYLDAALPPELEDLGRRAKIVTALPAQGTNNRQIMSVTPRRRMIVAGGGGGAVGTEIELRRFGGERQPGTAKVEVRLLDAAGNVVSSAIRDARWLTGQRQTLINLDLPAPLDDGQLGGAGRELFVEARLVAENEAAGVDALSADDSARAVVRVRRQLQIALIDSEEKLNEQPGALQPWQWVSAALSPMGPNSGGPFELTPTLPTAVSGDGLSAMDAAIVLRPDEMTTRGWDALAGFADRGGLVWVFTPAVAAEADWAATMTRVFDLPWQVGGQLSVFESTDDTAASDLPSVDETTPAPGVLQFLAADWREKLGWVDVVVRLPLTTPEEDRWITMQPAEATSAAGPSDADVLMASHAHGRGALVFTATALDTRFTNLPARALFVPLMHDTLRGVLGASEGTGPVTSGDRPELGGSWRGAGALSPVAEDESKETGLFVETEGQAVRLRDAAREPGVYTGRVGGSPRLLAVNPDANAGDTFTAQPQLEQLLDKLGGWSYWTDQQEQGGVLARADTGSDLTWPLLWIVLGLLLLETLLARRFSHATDTSRPTVVVRVLGALHGDDTAASPTNAGRAA